MSLADCYQESITQFTLSELQTLTLEQLQESLGIKTAEDDAIAEDEEQREESSFESEAFEDNNTARIEVSAAFEHQSNQQVQENDIEALRDEIGEMKSKMEGIEIMINDQRETQVKILAFQEEIKKILLNRIGERGE